MVEYDLAQVQAALTKEKLKEREPTLWRYRELLPVKNEDGQRQQAKRLRKIFYARLRSICSRELTDEKADAFRRRLRDPTREYCRLFTFLKYPQIQPTNNQAERSLRCLVIFRKICFGTRSAQGSYCHSVLPSLLETARRQGNHPFDFFKTLFISDTATAQAALYRHSL